MRTLRPRVPGDPAFARRVTAWLAALWLLRTGIRLAVRAGRRARRDRGTPDAITTSSPGSQVSPPSPDPTGAAAAMHDPYATQMPTEAPPIDLTSRGTSSPTGHRA